MSTVEVHQLNTGKVRNYNLHDLFETYEKFEFLSLIAMYESIPREAIKFVKM